jgi:LCP family protein required for cell wall assembly
MIVVSIDPTTKQVAMFTLPRDTVNVPLPPGFAHGAYGSVYTAKINSLWTHAFGRPDLFPGTELQRGFNALKQALSYLYGLQINYYVEVNFAGFKEVVDTLGGVTIDVQMPVVDDTFPGDNPGDKGIPERVYIPAGLQHMTGDQALVYARSRHGSNDFDRAARQQRVIVSLRNQTDIASIIPRLPALISSLRDTVHTDIPISSLPSLLALAGSVDTTNIRSYVFAPPLYEAEYNNDPFGLGRGYITVPDVAKIRAAVARAFTSDPRVEALREKIGAENPSVEVLDGNGDATGASNLAADLAYDGMNASAPLVAPKTSTPVTRIQVYNGAQSRLTETLALLKSLLHVTPIFVADHSVHVDIIITTSGSTPSITPPPAP